MKYTIGQVRGFVEGWLGSDSDLKALSIEEIKAMLNNALVTLECPNDGLAALVERVEYYNKQERPFQIPL
jgi:hypothetical protein